MKKLGQRQKILVQGRAYQKQSRAYYFEIINARGGGVGGLVDDLLDNAH